jgi:ubiquinone biosynthesis protein COQ9
MFGRGAVELVEHFADQVDKAWLAELEAQKSQLAALPSARERLQLAIQLRLRLLGALRCAGGGGLLGASIGIG